MTVDEAKALLQKNGRSYEDFSATGILLDGTYSLVELEAILVIARAKYGQPATQPDK